MIFEIFTLNQFSHISSIKLKCKLYFVYICYLFNKVITFKCIININMFFLPILLLKVVAWAHHWTVKICQEWSFQAKWRFNGGRILFILLLENQQQKFGLMLYVDIVIICNIDILFTQVLYWDFSGQFNLNFFYTH